MTFSQGTKTLGNKIFEQIFLLQEFRLHNQIILMQFVEGKHWELHENYEASEDVSVIPFNSSPKLKRLCIVVELKTLSPFPVTCWKFWKMEN